MPEIGIIKRLIAEKKLYGECPNPECRMSFPLTKAQLFHGKPLEGPALDAAEKWRSELSYALDQIKERKKKTRERSERGVLDVNIGKVLEKIAPALPGFSFNCHDCRPLFEPIDYIVFEGLTENGIVDSIKVIDIKTGTPQLSDHQRQIKEAIEEQRVEWKTYKKVV